MYQEKPLNLPQVSYDEFLREKEFVPKDQGFLVAKDLISTLLYDWQRDVVQWALQKGRAALFCDCGLGKGFPAHIEVMTPEGSKPIGEVKVGDPIIGSDGLTYKIIGVYPRGEQPVYRVSFSDGTSIVCDDDHLWNVMSPNDKARNKGYRTMSTKELRESNLRYGKNGKSRTWQIPLVAPVQFTVKELPLDPYVLGILLGDGMLSSTPHWIKPDVEITTRVARSLPEGMTLSSAHTDKRTGVPSWSIVNAERNPHTPNKVAETLKSLGLFGLTSSVKFVPQDYLYNSIENRLALLQGLMDTDGYAGETPEFCSTSQHLAAAVCFLAQSLGGTATIAFKPSPTYKHNGESRIGKPAYRVTMSLPPGINPFWLPRKAEAFKTPSRGVGRWIDSIEYLRQEATICIAVDSPDKLFVVQDFIVTHNTAMQLEWAYHVARHTNKPVLILAPLAVAQQTVREGIKFKRPCSYAKDASEIKSAVVVTNYERLDKFDAVDFGGVVLDESSILKAFMGSTKVRLLKRFETTPYRLACTATPAPNDHLELGNHAEFLGVMRSSEMLVRWFINYTKDDGSAMGKYRLKGHAVESFWDWVCSWARCVGKPSDLGSYSDEGYNLPELSVTTVPVKVDTTQDRGSNLWRQPSLAATDLHKEKRLTVSARAKSVADLVAKEPNEAWLIWCDTDYEADELMDLIPGAVEVRGSDSSDYKESAALWFVEGGDTKWNRKTITVRDESDTQVILSTEQREENKTSELQSKRKNTCENGIAKTKNESKRTALRTTKNVTHVAANCTPVMNNVENNSRQELENSIVTTRTVNGTQDCEQHTVLTYNGTTKNPNNKNSDAQSVNKKSDNYTSTIATLPEKSETCCVNPVTLESDTSKTTPSSWSVPQNTSGRIMISKPKIFGYGLNFQHCARVAFVGASYSFESFYQAIRRVWRFGQPRTVDCYIIVPETETQVWGVLKRKEVEHERMKTHMFAASKRASERSAIVKVPYNPTFKTVLPTFINAQGEVKCLNAWHDKNYSLYNADCVDLVRQLPDNSIGYAIYSPPFANLYTYSDSLCDMGNCADDEEFIQNYFFMIKELYRMLKPGRVVSVHCKNLVDYKGRDGRAGIRDFRGELIRIHEAAGFKYHSEVTIWKDPVIEMQRTKAHGLLWKQLRADSSFSRQGLPEYLVTFRKWAEEGQDIDPVEHRAEDYPVALWQKIASPVWMDIQQTKVLNGEIARDDKDEKHICPLQLEVIERGVVLWSNPGDVVFSPFAGIGSEGHESLRLGRKFIGVELKDAYCKHAVNNLNNSTKQMSLF